MKVRDLEIIGQVEPKLARAAGALSLMHDLYDAAGWIAPGKSKGSCILSSLTVRDYLWKIGFKDAAVVPVYLVIRGWKKGENLWSVGVGDHPRFYAAMGIPNSKPTVDRRQPDGWDGHVAVVSHQAGVLIDPTIGQCRRDKWPRLPGMVIITLPDGLPPVAALANHDKVSGVDAIIADAGEGEADDVRVEWFVQHHNRSWKKAPDAEKARRDPVVKEMVWSWRKGYA